MQWYLDTINQQLFCLEDSTYVQISEHEGFTVVTYFSNSGIMYHIPYSDCVLINTTNLELALVLYEKH